MKIAGTLMGKWGESGYALVVHNLAVLSFVAAMGLSAAAGELFQDVAILLQLS